MIEVLADATAEALVLVFWALVMIAFLHDEWIPSVIFRWGHHPQATASICAALAAALRERRDVAEGLDALLPTLPLLYRRRLERALVRLRIGEGTIVAPLAAARLLPPRLLRSLAAAEAIDRDALARTCALEADASGAHRPRSAHRPAAYGPYLVIFAAVLLFFSVFIAPKFEMIFDELGMPLPGSMQLVLGLIDSVFVFGIVSAAGWALLALAAVKALVWTWHRLQPWTMRLRRGDLLLAGIAAGRSEPDLAAVLGTTWVDPPPRLERAARAGDLPALIACAGWRARSVEALVLAVRRARARRALVTTILAAVGTILIPVALAVPVYLFAHAMFETIYGIAEVLAGTV